MTRFEKISLILIITLFIFTRLYKISEIPPSVYWDEASIGYNAYSVLTTGKDEWEEFLPIHFRAFGEFKLPVYIYGVVLSEAIFGLNEFAVRLPAVLFSLVTIIIIYFLGYKISGKRNVGIWSAFLMTVSSWFLIFSRTGYEVTAGLMFYCLGLFFMLSFYKSFTFLLLSTLFFILSMYSYNSFRVLVPLTFVFLIFLMSKGENLKKVVFYILISIFIFIVSLIPVFKVLIFDAGFGRVQSFTVFPTIKQVYDLEGKPKLQIIYDRSNDRKLNIGESIFTFAKNYLSHFSPDFLLFEGDKNLRSQQRGFGQIYIIDLILVILGIVYILKAKKKNLFILLILLLIGPLPASLFKESPHALRSLAVVPFICITGALGIEFLSKRFNRIYIFVLLAYLLLFGNYYWKFIFTYSVESSHDFQYSYKQIYKNYSDNFDNFEQIIISNQYAQPYIFALFYLKLPSEEFRKQVKYAKVEDWGFSTVTEIEKLKFRKIDQTDLPTTKSLIFVTPNEKLNNLKEIDVIKNLDNSVGLYVYQI